MAMIQMRPTCWAGHRRAFAAAHLVVPPSELSLAATGERKRAQDPYRYPAASLPCVVLTKRSLAHKLAREAETAPSRETVLLSTAQTEQGSTHKPYCYEYPRPAVTVDVVVLSFPGEELEVLLIRRRHDPFAGMWALPGGFVEEDEDLVTAAARELEEETKLSGAPMVQIGAFGAPGRDPRGRTISVAYLALLSPQQRSQASLRAESDAAEVAWQPLAGLPQLAFDHRLIIDCARERLRAAWQPDGAALALLPDLFTFAQAQSLYAAVMQERLSEQLFRSKLLNSGVVEIAGAGSAHLADGNERYRRTG